METDTDKTPPKQQPVPFGASLFVRTFFPVLALATVPVAIFLYLVGRTARTTLLLYLPPLQVAEFFQKTWDHGLFLLLFVFVGIVCLSFLFSRSITHPIFILTETVRRIAGGDQTVQVVMKRKDEIGQLVYFFNAAMRQFLESRERGVALSQIKSQFVTVAAHQLRTPLSAMKWSLRLMLDGDMGEINEKQREFLQQSYQTNEHLIRLVNDFLDISRIEEGRFGFHFKKTPIFDTIQKAVQESLSQAAIRGVAVSMESTVPADIEVIADESRMYTALTNILDNAIRYSNKGDNVTVEVVLKEGVLEVRVTDAGIGVPAGEQQKVFSRFYRASNAIRQQTEGSGLGLFIAKNIIERHGGAIWFTSPASPKTASRGGEEHKGTSVFFTLPAKEDFIKNQEASFQPPVEAA